MRIHCPHCLEETELENSVADSAVVCSACKKAFDPRKKDTLPHAARSDAASELLPGICAGDGFAGYVLEKKLGRGGMGVVFQATQLSLGRRVAIKVLAHELLQDPEFVKRFDREARVLASLNHANIVQVIDKGIERGNVFLIMEFVDGVSLRDLMAEKRLPPADALKIIPQLCDALEYAHSRGVVHRDIKPENILIGRDGSVKIADFGLAKIVGEGPSGRITRSNVVMGSLDYMAPEQRERTRDADHRADIYALGVVFYEVLTGELPLGRFEPPSKKVKLEVDLDEVVLKVLAKDPAMRYQRASEVGAEIRRRSGGQSPAPETAHSGAAGPVTAASVADYLDQMATKPLVDRLRVAAAVGFSGLMLLLVSIAGAFDSDRVAQGLSSTLATVGGLVAGGGLLLGVWLRLLERPEWRQHWGVNRKGRPRDLPEPIPLLVVAAIMIMIFLPRPVDVFLVAALVPLAAGVHSRSPRLFKGVPEMPTERTLPRELAHLAAPAAAAVAPAAPVAPTVPLKVRLSPLAFLGFLVGAALFVAGAFSLGMLAWARESDWAILDSMAYHEGRHTIAALLFTEPTAAHGLVTSVGIIGLIVSLLVAAFNGATLFSVGRKTGVRGGGYAFFGMLLAGVGAIASLGAMEWLGNPARQWREIDARSTDDIYDVTNRFRQAGRMQRLGAVGALARRGGKAVPLLGHIAANEGSVAIRYAATRALAQLARSEVPETREAARRELEPRKGDDVETIRDVAKWGFENPESRDDMLQYEAERSRRPTSPRDRFPKARGSAPGRTSNAIDAPIGQWLLVREADAVVAFRLVKLTERGEGGAIYEWIDASRFGRGGFRAGEVYEKYHRVGSAVVNAGGRLFIECGPFTLEWSAPRWIYFPEDRPGLAIAVTGEEDLDDVDPESEDLKWQRAVR